MHSCTKKYTELVEEEMLVDVICHCFKTQGACLIVVLYNSSDLQLVGSG